MYTSSMYLEGLKKTNNFQSHYLDFWLPIKAGAHRIKNTNDNYTRAHFVRWEEIGIFKYLSDHFVIKLLCNTV